VLLPPLKEAEAIDTPAPTRRMSMVTEDANLALWNSMGDLGEVIGRLGPLFCVLSIMFENASCGMSPA